MNNLPEKNKCLMIIYKSPMASKELRCNGKIYGRCEDCEAFYCFIHTDVFCLLCESIVLCRECSKIKHDFDIMFCKKCRFLPINMSPSGKRASLPISIPKNHKSY